MANKFEIENTITVSNKLSTPPYIMASNEYYDSSVILCPSGEFRSKYAEDDGRACCKAYVGRCPSRGMGLSRDAI